MSPTRVPGLLEVIMCVVAKGSDEGSVWRVITKLGKAKFRKDKWMSFLQDFSEPIICVSRWGLPKRKIKGQCSLIDFIRERIFQCVRIESDLRIFQGTRLLTRASETYFVKCHCLRGAWPETQGRTGKSRR